MHPRARFCFSLSALLFGAQSSVALLANDSPFKPPAAAAAPGEAPGETIEFAGVSRLGEKTDLIFFDKTTKKYRWVPLGETVEGIAALKYDAQRDQAIVRINGVQKSLPLRKGGAPTNAPAAVPAMHAGFNTAAPVPPPITAGAAVPMPIVVSTPESPQPGAVAGAAAAPVAQPGVPTPTNTPGTMPPPPTTEQGRQEQEARMLVSDLLEIGMAQRRAYEEAQRRAQGGEPATPTPGPNATIPPAQQIPPTVQPGHPTPPAATPPAPTPPPGGE